ncbi:unnamed protein product, partial [Timema podura]|nr:unnamed protein product [Timema podura]
MKRRFMPMPRERLDTQRRSTPAPGNGELDEFLMAKYNYKIDYNAAMKITSEIIVLEIIHRIIVFIYE